MQDGSTHFPLFSNTVFSFTSILVSFTSFFHSFYSLSALWSEMKKGHCGEKIGEKENKETLAVHSANVRVVLCWNLLCMCICLILRMHSISPFPSKVFLFIPFFSYFSKELIQFYLPPPQRQQQHRTRHECWFQVFLFFVIPVIIIMAGPTIWRMYWNALLLLHLCSLCKGRFKKGHNDPTVQDFGVLHCCQNCKMLFWRKFCLD